MMPLRDELVAVAKRGRLLGDLRVQEIGASLNDRGSNDLMSQVHEEVRRTVPGSGRTLEVAWDGIGEW